MKRYKTQQNRIKHLDILQRAYKHGYPLQVLFHRNHNTTLKKHYY